MFLTFSKYTLFCDWLHTLLEFRAIHLISISIFPVIYHQCVCVCTCLLNIHVRVSKNLFCILFSLIMLIMSTPPPNGFQFSISLGEFGDHCPVDCKWSQSQKEKGAANYLPKKRRELTMPKLFEDPGVDEFRGLDLRNLNIDEAWMVVKSDLQVPSWLYVLSDDCDQVSAAAYCLYIGSEQLTIMRLMGNKFSAGLHWFLFVCNDDSRIGSTVPRKESKLIVSIPHFLRIQFLRIVENRLSRQFCRFIPPCYRSCCTMNP